MVFDNGQIGLSLASQTWTQGAFGVGELPSSFWLFQPSYFVTQSDPATTLGRAINATGIQAMNPEVCGGGYFLLRGREAEGGFIHGGGYGIVPQDSRSGTSAGFLGEVGGGPFSLGHEE